MRRLGILLALLVALPASAEQGIARNGLSVAGDAERFEVFARAGLGGRDYFCAAANFARVHLGARATDRVVIVGGLGPSLTRPNRRSVVFALRPPDTNRGNAFGDILLRPRVEGTSRNVATGESLCREPLARDDDD